MADLPDVPEEEEVDAVNSLQQLRNLREFLCQFRFNYASELELQDGIQKALSATAYEVRREVIIGALGRLDFLVDGNLVIETKIGGSAPQLMRQVARYAQSEEIQAILVVTDRSSHSLPESFNGKPVLTHSLLDGAF